MRHLLQLWWQTALLWIWDRPVQISTKRADLHLLHEVLHELAVAGPPEDTSLPILGEGRKVTVEPASRGLGPAGSLLWGPRCPPSNPLALPLRQHTSWVPG